MQCPQRPQRLTVNPQSRGKAELIGMNTAALCRLPDGPQRGVCQVLRAHQRGRRSGFLSAALCTLASSISVLSGGPLRQPTMRALRFVRIGCPTLVIHLRVHRAAPLIERPALKAGIKGELEGDHGDNFKLDSPVENLTRYLNVQDTSDRSKVKFRSNWFPAWLLVGNQSEWGRCCGANYPTVTPAGTQAAGLGLQVP
jgi:hypothetical protein